jgi:hypothetical protein
LNPNNLQTENKDSDWVKIMKHDRNISMTGNKIFPKEILLGSDNGMQVVNTETLDFDEIFSNK